MLSPMPLGIAELTGVSPSPARFLASPLGGWPLPSPGIGATPGQYAAQDGRSSLEMFGLGTNEDARQRGHVEAFNLLSNLDGIHRGTSALKRGPSAAQLDNYAPEQTGNEAIDNQENAEAHKAMLQQIKPQLDSEMQNIVAEAKKNVGMENYDSSKMEEELQRLLAARTTTLTADYYKTMTDPTNGDFKTAPVYRRNKRPISSLDDVLEHEMPAKKRLESIKSLEERLQVVGARNAKLREAVNQAESKCKVVRAENGQLWAAAAHIMAALQGALEARRQAAIAFVQQGFQMQQEAAQEGQPEGEQQVQQKQINMQQLIAAQQAGLTPGVASHLAGLFSPCGDDIFSACKMFVSPLNAPVLPPTKDNPSQQLFAEEAAKEPVVEAEQAAVAPAI